MPGALEIPAAIRLALDRGGYDAFVALGCVIRGETSHYDIVAGESARGLMELGMRHGALIGNGILTTDNGAQARVRASPDRPEGKDKGGDAARAALALLQVRRCMERMTRRRAARFGAVQALYQIELSGAGPET